MIFKITLLSLSILFISVTTIAQNLNNTKTYEDSYNKGKILYKERKYDEAIEAFKISKTLASKSGDTISTTNALSRIGLCYLGKEDYKISEKYFKRSLELEIICGDSARIAKGFNNIGITKYYLSELDSCLFYYKKALSIYQNTSNKKLPKFLKNIGLVYKKKGDYINSSKYLFQAAKMFENKKNNEEAAAIYSIIGNMYNESGYDSLSLHYHNLGLKLRKDLNDNLAIAQSMNNIANIIRKVYGIDTALVIYNKALTLTKRVKNKRLESIILNNIGEIYLELSNSKTSREFFLSSLKIKKSLSDQHGIAHTTFNLAKLDEMLGNYEDLERHLSIGISISKNIKAPNLLVKYYGLYSKYLTSKKEYKNATQYFKLYLNLKDSLLNELKVKSISEAEIKYQTSQLEKQVAFLKPLENEIEILNLKTENQENKLKFQNIVNWTLGISIFLMLIIILLILRISNQRKRMNVLLELKNEEVTHRVKNNLEILTMIFKGQSRMIKDEKIKSILDQNQHRIKAINHLHRSLSKTPEIGVSSKIYFDGMIDDLLFSLNFPKINCSLTIENLRLDADMMLHIGLLMNELVTNAIKHGLRNVQNPRLDVSLIKKNQFIELKIRDNGQGIDKSIDLNNVDSYGMTLVKKLTNRQLDGNLNYSYQNGAIFTIKIPI